MFLRAEPGRSIGALRETRALGLSDTRVLVVPSSAERLEFLQPDLLQKRQFVIDAEPGIVLYLDNFQDFELKLVRAKFVPFPLELSVSMPADGQHEFVAVERPLQIEAAPEKNLPVQRVPHLEYPGWLLPFLVCPFQLLFRLHGGCPFFMAVVPHSLARGPATGARSFTWNV